MHAIILLAVLGQFPSFQPAISFPSFQPARPFRQVIVAPVVEDSLEVISFSAKWCGPCRQVTPILMALSAGGIRVYHIDTDRYADYTRQWKVAMLPTCIVVRKGKEVSRHAGVAAIEKLKGLQKERIQ